MNIEKEKTEGRPEYDKQKREENTKSSARGRKKRQKRPSLNLRKLARACVEISELLQKSDFWA